MTAADRFLSGLLRSLDGTLAADDDDLANPARIAALFARYTARDVRSKLRNIFGGH